MADEERDSVDRFGYEWVKYDTLLPMHEEQFLLWTCLIKKEEWKNKKILDVGCGTGRNSFWPLTYGALYSVAIDLDDRSLDVARKMLKDFPNSKVEKNSAYNIPYKREFDITYSVGVIHHLEKPELALENMHGATKEGGKLLIWVYGKENMTLYVKLLDPFRKYIFSKLPLPITHFLSIFPTVILYILLKVGLGKIKYFNLIRKFSFRHLRSIIFDQMLPHIANYWTKGEVYNLMKLTGLINIKIASVNNMSWCCIGEKASTTPNR